MRTARVVTHARPDPVLSPYVRLYRLCSAEPGAGEADILLPGEARIRAIAAPAPWQVRVGARTAPLPVLALIGPAARTGFVAAAGGSAVEAVLTAPGWARLVGGDARRFADRVVPLAAASATLAAAFAGRQSGSAPPVALFDDILLSRLAECPPEPDEVARLAALIEDPGIATVADLAGRAGIGARQLTRVVQANFGFTPKRLLRRARFLRALARVSRLPRGGWAGAIAGTGYYDHAHFLRDCRLFLDMPLGAFLALASRPEGQAPPPAGDRPPESQAAVPSLPGAGVQL